MPSLAPVPTDNAPAQPPPVVPPVAQPAPTPAPSPAQPVSTPTPTPPPSVSPASTDSYAESAAAATSASPQDAAMPANQAPPLQDPAEAPNLPEANEAVARKFSAISANPMGLSPEEHARVYGSQAPPTTPTPGGFDLAESPAVQKPQDTSGFNLAESPLSKQQTPQPTPGGYDLPESKGATPGGYDLPESVAASTAPPPPIKPPAQLLSEKYENNHQAIIKAGGEDPSIDSDLVLNALKYADAQKGIPIPGDQVNAATLGGQAIKDIAPWLDPMNNNTWAMVGGMIKGVPEFIQGTGNQAKETLENLGQMLIPNANRSRMQILSDQLFKHQITLNQYNTTLAQIRSGLSSGEAPALLPQEKSALAESEEVQARTKAEALPSFELGLRQNGEVVSNIWRNVLGFEVNSPIGSALRWLGQGSGDMDVTPEQQIMALSNPAFPIPLVRARDAATMDDHDRLVQLMSMRAQTNITKGLQAGHVSPLLQPFNTAYTQGNTPEHLDDIGYPVRPEYIESGASMVNQALMVPEFAAAGEASAAMGLDSLANTAGGYMLRAGSQVPKMIGDVASVPFNLSSSILKGTSNFAAKYPRILGMGLVTGVNTALHTIEPGLSLPFHGEMADYLLSKPLGNFLSPPISTGLSAMSNWVGAVPKGIRMLTEPFTQGLDLAGRDMIADGGNLLSSRASWDSITKKPMSAEELASMTPETSTSSTGYDLLHGRKIVYDTSTDIPASQLPRSETGKIGLLPSPDEPILTKERAIPPPKKGAISPPEVAGTNGQTPPVGKPTETPIVTQSTELGRQNPVTNAIRQIAPGITHGAVSTYPLAYLSSPDDPESQGKFMALGMALGAAGAPAALGDVVKNTLFDHLFSRDPSVSRPGIDVAPIKYGTRSDLDNASLAEINRIEPKTGQYAYSNAQKQAFHTARFAMNGAAEIHLLPPSLYEREMNAMNARGVIQNPDVNSRGVAIDPNPSAKVPKVDVSNINPAPIYGPPEMPQGPPELQQSRILIRGTPASLDAALTHEMSHPFVNRMSIEDQDHLFNLITRQNDPNVFTHDYTNGVTNYDHLPSEDGVANGTEPYVAQLPYMTKEDMKREMITENLSGLFKGDLLTKYSRNPSLIRGGQMALGNILERMGIDTTTGLSNTILGVKPSFGASVILDALTRESMQKNTHLRTPQGPGGAMARPLDAPPGTVDLKQAAEDAAIVRGLVKLGYTPEQASAQLAMSKQVGASRENSNAPKQSSPAEIAKGILVKGRGFTQDEADRHVPADAQKASEAANKATMSILSERKAKGIPSPDEEKAAAPQTEDKPFVPSKDWQPVPSHIMLANPEGAGMELKLDAGGGKLARWANPPGRETILNRRTGKLQDRAKSNGFIHDTPNGEPIETPEIYPDEIGPNDLPPSQPEEPPIKSQHMPAGASEKNPDEMEASKAQTSRKPGPEYHPTGTIRQRTDGTWALHVGMNHEAHTPFVRLFRTDKAAEFARDDLQKKYGPTLMDHVTADKLAKPEVKPPEAVPQPKETPKPPTPELVHGAGGSFPEPVESPGQGIELTSKGVTEHGKRKGKPVMGAPSSPLPQAPVTPPAPAAVTVVSPPVTLTPTTPLAPTAAAPVEPTAPEQQTETQETPTGITPQETPKPAKQPRKQKQQGATPESAPLQKHLREKEGMSTGEAHATVFGEGKRGALTNRGEVPDQTGNIGYFGYPGDSGWDSKSARGIGGFPFSSKEGSLIPDYSAAMKLSEGTRRGLKPGQEFKINGQLFRWDDVVPSDSPVKEGYIDVFQPSHEADRGVSEATIEERRKISEGIEFSGSKGGLHSGESSMKAPESKSIAPSTPVPQSPQPYNLPEGAKPVTARSIGAAEEAAISAATNKTGAASQPGIEAYDNGILQSMIQTLGQQHLASLPIGDTRVQLQPDSGMIAGTHFVQGDAFHDWLLRNQPPEAMQIINHVQDAIAGKQDLFLNYGSAVHGEPGTPTGSQREQAQILSPAQAREKGTSEIQEAGKHIIPTYMSVAPKSGGPNTVTVGGVSPDKIIENSSHISHELGPRSPYPPMLDNGTAQEDLRGYLSNVSSGVKGSGEGKLTPLPGHEQDVPKTPPDFTPYPLGKKKASFWNLAINGPDSKMSDNAKRAPKSAKAFELARLNEGYAKDGYTNSMAHSIDMAHGPMPVMVNDPANPEGPKIPKLKGGKPVTQLWTQGTLHSGYERINVPLIKTIHEGGEEGAPPIHVSNAAATTALQEKGLPPSQTVKAGFMPSETTGFVSPEYGSGKDFKEAGKDFTGENHRQAKTYFNKVDRTIAKMSGKGASSEAHDVFGDFPTGAEASVMTEHQHVPYDLAKAGEAAKAMHQRQLSSLVWEEHPQGAQMLHTIDTDLSPEEARAQLSKHGIENRTILADTPSNEPTRIKLYNPGPGDGHDITDNVAKFIDDPDSRVGGRHTYANGHGEFIGDPAWESRDAAADEYRRVSKEVQSSRPDLDWKDYNDHWAEAERHHQQIKGETSPSEQGLSPELRHEGINYGQFMPGHVIELPETGERETVKSAAMRLNGKVYEAGLHGVAKKRAEFELGRPVKKGEADEGYTTEPSDAYPDGRFVDRKEGWTLARDNNQLREGAREMQPYSRLQRTQTGGKVEGLASEDLLRRPAKVAFMPGDVVERPDTGERETVIGKSVRFPNGNIYTHPKAHAMALMDGWNHGEPDDADVDSGYMTSNGRFITDEEGWALAKSNNQLASGAKRISDMTDEEKAQRQVIGKGRSGLESSDLLPTKLAFIPGEAKDEGVEKDAIREQMGANTLAAKSAFMPGEAANEDKESAKDVVTKGANGNSIRETSDYEKGTSGDEMVRYREPVKYEFTHEEEHHYDPTKTTYANKAQFLPPVKAPKEVRESYETPERRTFIAQVQKKAQDWLDQNEAHPISSASEKTPEMEKGSKMTVEQLADHLLKQHKKLDLSKPSVRQTMSEAVMHDVMTQVAKNGNGVGWYDVTPDSAINHVAKNLDPSILSDPEHTFIYKVSQAITSQNQSVYDNAETGYHAYQYWKEHGKLPTEKKDIVNGGTQFKQILTNFKLVNDLIKEYGSDGLQKLFDTTMTVKDMRDKGLTVNGESPDFEMQGSLALGPKIGAFYSALNKHFQALVMDLWFSRSMNRMTGTPFKFGESSFRKQMGIVKDQMTNGDIDIPPDRRQKILQEINGLENRKTLNRDAVFKQAPELADWANERHKAYMYSSDAEGKGTYVDKNPVSLNAKNMDVGLHKTQDAPKGPKQRDLYRDVMTRAQKNIKDQTGIDMTIADLQAQLWYSEQNLYKKVGALRKKSENVDYLDAAHALVEQQKAEPGMPTTESKEREKAAAKAKKAEIKAASKQAARAEKMGPPKIPTMANAG